MRERKKKERNRDRDRERRDSKERDSHKDPYVSNLGHLFQTEIPTGQKLPGELAVYIHAYASDHVGYAHSQLQVSVGWNTGQPANEPFEVSVIQQHKLNSQGTYISAIIPTAAVLVNAKVTQSMKRNLSSCIRMWNLCFKLNHSTESCMLRCVGLMI